MSSPDKNRSRSQSRSNSLSRPATNGSEELDPPNKCLTDESDWDLSARLELARTNSRNQHGRELPVLFTNPPVEDTIYEGNKQCSILSLFIDMTLKKNLLLVPL
jgi:hypothetical protein